MRKRAKKCPLCGVKLTDKLGLPNSKHLDHILPIGQGGTHTHGNTRITCADCNLKRPKDGSDFTGQLTLWAQGPAPVSRSRKPHPPRNTDTCGSGLHPWIPANIEISSGQKRCKPCRIAGEEKRRRSPNGRQCKCGVMFLAPGATIMCPACVEVAARQGAELHASGLTWRQVAARVGYGTGEGARYAAKRIGYALAPRPAKANPLCPGCGTPKPPGRCQACLTAKAWQAVELRQAGMTLEEIAAVVGYTSKTSVTNLLKTVVTVKPYARGVTLSDEQAMARTMSSIGDAR